MLNLLEPQALSMELKKKASILPETQPPTNSISRSLLKSLLASERRDTAITMNRLGASFKMRLF
jgi:hypothetical protein